MSSEVCGFLPDPSNASEYSCVFMRLWPIAEVQTIEQAMAHLRDKAPVPVILTPVRTREKSLALLVRASERPRIEFGRSPARDRDQDMGEILSVLGCSGVQAVRAQQA
jgi:hypothetical protein